MPGTPSGRSIVREFSAGGGGYGNYYNFNPAAEQEALAVQVADEKRRQESFDLAKARDKREQDREDREQAKADRYEARQETVERGLAKVDEALSNPASLKFQDAYIKVMGDPDVRAASAFSAGRQAVKELMNQRHQEHQDYVQGWNDTLSHYMYDGGIHSIGDEYLSKDGTPNWAKLEPLLDSHLKNRRAEQANAQYQKMMQLQEMAKAAKLRPTGIDEKSMTYKYGKQDDPFLSSEMSDSEGSSPLQPAPSQGTTDGTAPATPARDWSKYH
jgi:hypothetical protein